MKPHWKHLQTFFMLYASPPLFFFHARLLDNKNYALLLNLHFLSRFTVSILLAPGSFLIQSLMQSWWQLFCLPPCQGPSKIMNMWRQCCGYIWSHFERFGVRGMRLHFAEAVSHQCLPNEICLLGFLIPLAVITLVNSDAFNKRALALLDSGGIKSIVSCLWEEHSAGLQSKLNV